MMPSRHTPFFQRPHRFIGKLWTLDGRLKDALQSNFIEITLPHGCSPVNLLHIFRTPFLKNTSGRLLLKMSVSILDKKRFQFSSINLFPPSLLSINRMYFPSFDRKLFLIAQTAHDGITLRTLFPKLSWTHHVCCL